MRKSHPLLAGIESVTPYRLAAAHSLYSIKPPAMQIESFLPVGGIMGLTSYPGVGKTWLAMEVARSVASGTPFLGRYPAQRGGVLFVGSDSSLYDYARQWTRLTRHVPDAVDAFEPVRFLVQSEFMFEDRDEVRRLIRTHQTFEWGDPQDTPDGPRRPCGFHVIVFDTLSRLTRANQNDNTEMEEVFRCIRWIAEATDAAVILLHHNAKRSEYNDGTDWRGAMSQIGALDSWVQLVPHKRDKYLVGVTYKKFRGITPSDFSLRMAVEDPETASLTMVDEAVTIAQRMEHDVLADSVREYVAAHPGCRLSDLRENLWPQYSLGVESFAGTMVRFDQPGKLSSAIRNRLTALAKARVIIATPVNSRLTTYVVVEEKKCQSTPTSAQPDTAGTKSEPAAPAVKSRKPRARAAKKPHTATKSRPRSA